MKIRHEPSALNAYWYASIGEHRVLHLGCFGEPLERGLEVYMQLLGRLYLKDSSLWLEFQSTKGLWLDQRRRDRRLAWKAPVYSDESYLAYEIVSRTEISLALKRFWLLKELRFYFWNRGNQVDVSNLIAGIARTEFKDLGRCVPTAIRFIAERELCRSYLRIMFHEVETNSFQQSFAESIAMSGIDFQLEASVFRE